MMLAASQNVRLMGVRREQVARMQNQAMMVRQNRAMFSSLNNHKKNDDDKEKNQYSNKFDDLLGKASTPLSKEEREFIERQVETKRLMEEEAKKKHSIDKEKMAQKSASDFEKLSRGEKIVSDEKNLQQIFTSFYESVEKKRKNVDVKA